MFEKKVCPNYILHAKLCGCCRMVAYYIWKKEGRAVIVVNQFDVWGEHGWNVEQIGEALIDLKYNFLPYI